VNELNTPCDEVAGTLQAMSVRFRSAQ
jgi:hypothetical protein